MTTEQLNLTAAAQQQGMASFDSIYLSITQQGDSKIDVKLPY